MGCKGLHCPGCSSGGSGSSSGGPVILVLVLVVIVAAVVARSAHAIRHGADEVGHVLTVALLVVGIAAGVAVASAVLFVLGRLLLRLRRWHRGRVRQAPMRLVDARTPEAVDAVTPASLAAGWRSIARTPVRALPRPNGAPARERSGRLAMAGVRKHRNAKP